MSSQDARELLKRLETMLRLIAKYWGRQPSGTIECYVVEDLSRWAGQSINAEGLASIRAGAGVTLSQKISRGNQFVAKAVVYCVSKEGVPLHEAVHAYCEQTFGTVGPTWYAEGMAEMGHYWREGDRAVALNPVVLKHLRESPVKPMAEILAPGQHTGDSWQNYAWRWALCHLLANNPNYSTRFEAMGIQLLVNQQGSFEQTFGSMAKEIDFEYRFFLKHLSQGYRTDLCGWDWKRKFTPLRSAGRTLTCSLSAARGWQATAVIMLPGIEYRYTAEGTWKPGKDQESVDANGGAGGAGRLVGILWKDYQLSEPFDLGAEGTLKPRSEGSLFVRCQSPWNKIAENTGRMTFKIKVKDKEEAEK